MRTTIPTEIILNMIPTIRRLRQLFGSSTGNFQVLGFDDEVICGEGAGELAAVDAVAYSLGCGIGVNIGLYAGANVWYQWFKVGRQGLDWY